MKKKQKNPKKSKKEKKFEAHVMNSVYTNEIVLGYRTQKKNMESCEQPPRGDFGYQPMLSSQFIW